MKTVTGRVFNSEPIPLSKAAALISRFASSENDANQAVRAYLRRASAAFTELKSIHREIKSSSVKEQSPISDVKPERSPTREPGRAKGVDDLVGDKGKILLRMSEKIAGHGREQDDIKEDMKWKKKKSKKNEEEDAVEEKVKVKAKLEKEQRNQEKKEKEKKKKKKMKSDGEIGSEERKSKKKRKSKEIDG